MSRIDERVTRGNLKKLAKRKAEEESLERQEKRFLVKNSKVISPNDVIVNQVLGKVKIEEDYVAVKTEVGTDPTDSISENLRKEFLSEPNNEGDVEQKISVVEDFLNIPTDHPENLANDEQNEDMEIVVKEETNSECPDLVSDDAQQNGVQRTNEVDWHKLLPHICKYLELKTLLDSRLICQDWRFSVDLHFENESQFYKKYTFRNKETLAKFVDVMEHCTGNPFFGTTVTFEFTKPHDEWRKRIGPYATFNVYWKLVETLLSKFGHYLKDITFCQNGYSLHLYKLLETCLPHLPNAESITIKGHFQYKSFTREEEETAEKLSIYMADKSLPQLKNLHTLEFGFQAANIQEAMINACPKVSTLNSKVLLENMGNLIRKLPLKELKWCGRPSDYKCLDNLPTSLENLEFDYSPNYGHEDDIDNIKLENFLHAFQRLPGLRKVSLRGSITLGNVRRSNKLQHKALQELVLNRCYMGNKRSQRQILRDIIQTGGYYATILSNFPNIQTVFILDECVDNPSMFDENDSKLVYSSKIWEVFKSLEDIKLAVRYDSYSTQRSSDVPFMTPRLGRRTRTYWTRENYLKFRKNWNCNFRVINIFQQHAQQST